ncbi:ATP-binding protein [Fibrella sp. HMF5335]|uniref:ATP-binding protein n=1 Tax=Fibrella rubiginis TaxID=2817060 RepID=A0A939GHA8_9BACT|nr:ATP-binding protein [Fibrella rubiginis]MBO0939019.1 ATP-binding protein [Fibrella rubiginis]
MIPRLAQSDLLQRLAYFPAVALLGPRQAGKTTLAQLVQINVGRPSVYFDLERSSDLAKFQHDPVLFLEQFANQTVILDEIHRLPNLFPDLRGLIDRNRLPGRFILLGSASPDLLKNTSESLTGRIAYVELTPFLLRELPVADYQTHWLRGGFPNSMLAPTTDISVIWREDFIRNYVERDLPQLGLPASPTQSQRLLTLLANQQGGLLNQSALANALQVRNPVMTSYLSFLEQAFLVRRLQPYYTNVGKRLTKAPKLYLRDSGLLHQLLRLYDTSSLFGHPVVGGSWEGYVLEQIIPLLRYDQLPFFYRTADGAELDLVVESQGKIQLAVEIKLSDTPTLSKGVTVALQDLGNPPLLVVTPSSVTYQLRQNVTVCSVVDLPDQLAKLLH